MLLIRRCWLFQNPWRVGQHFHHFEHDGTGTSYYPLRAHEQVIRASADWRAEMVPEMKREAILQTV